MRLPAGKYYIGDMCYTIGDNDVWQRSIEQQLGEPDDDGGHQVKIQNEDGSKTYTWWQADTENGDGEFTGSDGRKYPVDTGAIGIIAFDLVDEYDEKDGSVREFTSEFFVSQEDGVFYFGDLTIDTTEEEEEEDYEDGWDEEDDEDEDDEDDDYYEGGGYY